MTKQPSEGIKRSKGKFDPFQENRQWSAAASEERCKRIARNTGKRLVEIIDVAGLLAIVMVLR